MLIAKAYAQAAVDVGETVGSVPAAPGPMESFMWNMGLVLILVILFYILLIRPQQKRFREHSAMLDDLKAGDKVVTGGGLVGKIEKIAADAQELVIDLGNGMKVTAMRNTLQSYQPPPSKEQNNKKKRAL